MSSNFEKNKGFSFTAGFLILLGIVFLLNNFGILSWDLWQNLWKFWPILLVLFGVEIILGRNASVKSFVFLLILIFLVPTILVLNPFTGNPLATKKINFERPLGNLTKASFKFELPSTNLKITNVNENATEIFTGFLKYSQVLPKPTLSENRHFGEAAYKIVQTERKQVPLSNNIGNSGEFKLTNAVPLELVFKSNTAVLDLNLKKLRVSALQVDSKAGSINVIFPKDFSTRAYFLTQASLIKLTIPKENGVSLKIDSSFKSLKLDSERFKKFDKANYKSTNFDTSQIKIEIEISGSASNIEIN